MRLDDSQRRFLSRRAWQIYPAFYALGVYLGFTGALVIPFIVAIPLVGVAVMFTLLEWRLQPRLGFVALGVAVLDSVLAWMVLLRQPASFLTWFWSVAMLVPLVLTFVVLRLSPRIPMRPSGE